MATESDERARLHREARDTSVRLASDFRRGGYEAGEIEDVIAEHLFNYYPTSEEGQRRDAARAILSGIDRGEPVHDNRRITAYESPRRKNIRPPLLAATIGLLGVLVYQGYQYMNRDAGRAPIALTETQTAAPSAPTISYDPDMVTDAMGSYFMRKNNAAAAERFVSDLKAGEITYEPALDSAKKKTLIRVAYGEKTLAEIDISDKHATLVSGGKIPSGAECATSECTYVDARGNTHYYYQGDKLPQGETLGSGSGFYYPITISPKINLILYEKALRQ